MGREKKKHLKKEGKYTIGNMNQGRGMSGTLTGQRDRMGGKKGGWGRDN